MQSRAGGWPRGVSAGHSRRRQGGQHPGSETLCEGDTGSPLLHSSGTKLLQHPVPQCDFHLQEGDFHFLGLLEPV